MRFYILLFIVVSFSSCEKEEKPVAPATVQGQTASLGELYETQSYFNIIDNIFVKSQEHFGFDLSFSASAEEKTIYLNSSNIMFLRNFGVVPFSAVTDTASANKWLFDYPTGENHRTAFGVWYNNDGTSKNEIFVLDRGYDAVGNSFGFIKLQILSVSETNYILKVAELDGSNERTVTIIKNPNYVKVHFSFNDDKMKDVEPAKDDWNLLFSQYTDFDITTDGDTIPYSVRGALLNQYNTQSAKVEDIPFGDIYLDMVPQLEFSSALNAIGYNWKYFSLIDGYYTVLPDVTYVVKTDKGTYYKLRFLDFYNDEGIKGYPKFEVIGL